MIFQSIILSDFKRLCILITIAAALAFIINLVRSDSLKMVYVTPAQKMKATLEHHLNDIQEVSVTVVTIDNVIQAVKNKSHLIIDARPDLFWEIGHIPSAINLPVRQFESHYKKNEPLLTRAVATEHPLLLYCADLHCPDASALAEELIKRGFKKFLLFEDGWAAWEEAGLSVETK